MLYWRTTIISLVAGSFLLCSSCRSLPHLQDGGELSTVQVVRIVAPSIVRLQTGAASPGSLSQKIAGDGFGTGVIIDSVGHIVTNRHVIVARGSETVSSRIVATTHNGRSFPAKVVGMDWRLDIAVLKIEASDLAPAAFADPVSLEVGQDVIAVGFALDIDGPPTVSRGVISALRRKIINAELVIPDAIQTDAGIHPGNSGGPLANTRGEIIGINTAVASGTPGIGFAISNSILRPAVESLISKGKVERAYLGVSTVDSSVQIELGPLTGKGVPIIMVIDNSPAQKAGLRARDVIVAIAGEAVVTGSDLVAILAKHRPGDRVPIEFYRGEEQHTLRVTFTEQPDVR